MNESKEGMNDVLNLEKMGILFQLSGVIKCEDESELEGSTVTPANMKTYGANNNLLTFMTEGGLQYVTRSNSQKLRELEAAGYTNSGMGVPFSNGQKPKQDTPEWDQYDAMMKED